MSERDELTGLIMCLRYDDCDEGCKQPCELSRQTREKAASLLERDGAELAELRRWKEEAVLSCARKRCGQREARIAELDAEVARLTTQLHRREADLLAQMNTNIEVGNLYDAALARAEAAAREAVAAWMIEHAFATGHGDTLTDLLAELSWQIAEIKRDAIKWRDTPIPVPPGECPYPIHADRSIEACVAAGDCGCGQNKT